jgi:hypothetical protein
MTRIWTLTVFLIRDLFRSLAGVVPLAAGLAFGLIAFEYGMDQTQYIMVAGVGTGAICLITGLLLASRANRASSYVLVARLPWRGELLVALVVGSLLITATLTLLITGGNLLANRLTLEFPSILWILPTWLPFWLLMAALALPLSPLAGQNGSEIVSWVLLTALLVANDQKARLQERGLNWLAQGIVAILWPVNTLLSQASAGIHGRSYFLAVALTLAYAGLAFGLAVGSLTSKDLLWAE